MGRFGIFVSLVGQMAFAAAVAKAAHPVPLSKWNGEYLNKKQGTAYLQMRFRKFPSGKTTDVITDDVRVFLYSYLKKKSFVLSHSPRQAQGQGPGEIWKMPAGKYGIRAVTLVDATGTKRVWKPSKRQSIVVKRLRLSNLGLWIATARGKKGLAVKMKMVPNSYEERSKKDSSLVSVINGFNGLIQERFAGKKLIKKAKRNYEKKGQMRATATIKRSVAMYYKLDLHKHNHHAEKVASVLSASDADIRSCYTDRLVYNGDLKGKLKFAFILSKRTHAMKQLKHIGGTLDSPKLIRCVYHQLIKMSFPINETMIGKLTYTFDIR